MLEILKNMVLVSVILIFGYSIANIILSRGKIAKQEIKKTLFKLSEKSYADGQKDYYKKDIRFDAYRNCWIKSPWSNKQDPITYVKCDNYKGK